MSQTTSTADSDSMTMHGGQEGTVFKSLTVQGEDRIRLDFERPALDIQLDPSQAPGLDWGSARDVLDRTTPDLATPLVMTSARETSPYLGHPWLSHFASGAVARFQPDLKGVESWKLSIVNARGEAVHAQEYLIQAQAAAPTERRYLDALLTHWFAKLEYARALEVVTKFLEAKPDDEKRTTRRATSATSWVRDSR